MLNIDFKDYWPTAEKAVKSFANTVFPGFFSEAELDELVGDVVERMWKYREKYDGNKSSVATWVSVIARNIILTAAEKESRRRSLFSSMPLGEREDENGDVLGFVPVAGDETDADLLGDDTERAFRESLSLPRDRRLFDLLVAGYDAAEMAESEHVNINAIYTALCHLRKRLHNAA